MKLISIIALSLSVQLTSFLSAAPKLDLLVNNLKEPTWMTAPHQSSNYFYILEKKGIVKVFDRKSAKLLEAPFLDISKQIKIRMNEQGLLGMAFCPNFNKTGRFYLNYTDLKGTTRISRFVCDPTKPTVAKPNSEEILLQVKQDFVNHNGGWIDFGPDGYLYIGLGDGGAANDPHNRAQDLTSHLGKLLRLDVSPDKGYKIPKDNPLVHHKAAKPEIYAYGLRNPWRCSWDSKTNDFYIADVGQNKQEEINFMPAGKGKAANYGWRKREGHIATPRRNVGGERPNGAIDPVYTYTHGMGKNQGISLTGGFVYRGEIQSLQGRYFFADYINPRIWSITVKDNKATDFTDWTDQLRHNGKRVTLICSFAQDPQGELYIISHSGSIYKIVE